MKKILIILILLIPCILYAEETNSEETSSKVTFDISTSYNITCPFTYVESNLYYAYGTKDINIVPYVGGKCWMLNDSTKNNTTFTYNGSSYLFGLRFNWKYFFIGIERFILYTNEDYEYTWKKDNYWLTHKGIPFYIGCEFKDICNTGIGFSAKIASNIPSNVSVTEIIIRYKYYYNNWFAGLYGKQKTWFLTNNYIKGNPYCDIYTVGLEVGYKGITIWLEHYCAHDVFSKWEMWEETYQLDERCSCNIMGITYKFN